MLAQLCQVLDAGLSGLETDAASVVSGTGCWPFYSLEPDADAIVPGTGCWPFGPGTRCWCSCARYWMLAFLAWKQMLVQLCQVLGVDLSDT